MKKFWLEERFSLLELMAAIIAYDIIEAIIK